MNTVYRALILHTHTRSRAHNVADVIKLLLASCANQVHTCTIADPQERHIICVVLG